MKKVILSAISALFAQIILAQGTITVIPITSSSCDSLCTGTATLNFYGAMLPVTYSVYSISPPSSFIGTTNSNSVVINNLCAGTYSVYANDAMGAWGYNMFTVGQIPVPSITNVSYAPSMPPSPPSLYTATASISGGTPPYYVTWTGYMGNPTKTHTVSGTSDTAYLYPGDYSVTVTDYNNVTNGCPGNGSFYTFSICDPNAGVGMINILPNDTLCQGTTYTVQYMPMPFGPLNIINASTYADSTANCIPMSSTNPFAVLTCTATQNTSFYGYWWYANGCAPVMYQPASIVVMNCTDVKSVNILPENVLIYPNPSDGYLKFHFNKKTDELIEAEITDITGKLLIKKAVAPDKEEYFDLPQGIYYLKISSKEYSRVQRLVIIK